VAEVRTVRTAATNVAVKIGGRSPAGGSKRA
jgi:hypothetical protein